MIRIKFLIICLVIFCGSVKAQNNFVSDSIRTSHLSLMYTLEYKKKYDLAKAVAIQYTRDATGALDYPFMHGLIICCSNLGQTDTCYVLMRQQIANGDYAILDRIKMDFQLGPLLEYKDSIVVWQNEIDSAYFSQWSLSNPFFNRKLAKQILDIYIADQWPRAYDYFYPDTSNHYNRDSANVAWLYADSIDQVLTGQIFEEYGWPTSQMVGLNLTEAIWSPLQHATVTFQKKYIKLAYHAYKSGNLSSNLYAGLVDRLEANQGKKQTYGTQYKIESNGEWVQCPIKRKCFLKRRLRKMNLENTGTIPQ